eukprot:m.565401 g.565401  ORF g.565401 m.565401 type:complete len:444 (-) comp22242_c0_seq17:1358-2689(-)
MYSVKVVALHCVALIAGVSSMTYTFGTSSQSHTTDITKVCTTNNGSACAVPFYYDGILRHEAVYMNITDAVSCPIEVGQFDRVIYSEDAIMPASCKTMICKTESTNATGVSEGTPCVFPFYEYHTLRYSCVVDDVWGQPAWCATEIDDNFNYGYKKWGVCNCEEFDGKTTIKTTTADPTVTIPENPPAPPHAPGEPNDQQKTESVDAVAVMTTLVAVVCVLGLALIGIVAHRRGTFRRMKDRWQEGGWFRELAPKGFRLPSGWYQDLAPKGFKYTAVRSSANPADSVDVEQDMEDIVLNPSTTTDYGTNPKTEYNPVFSHPTVPSSGRAAPHPSAKQSTRYEEPNDIDWDAMEAAAAKLRTCRIKKQPGEKIGLRLLNYQGPNYAGARVVGVNPGSPGHVAGVVEGDSIVEINNQPIINLYHQEVIEVLVQAGNSFDIIVCRD